MRAARSAARQQTRAEPDHGSFINQDGERAGRRRLRLAGAQPVLLDQLEVEFVNEVLVVLGLTARFLDHKNDSLPTVDVHAVHHGRAMVLVEQFDPICT